MPETLIDAGEYECPHCKAVFEADENDQFADDIRDECDRECSECGKRFQVVCTMVEFFLESFPALKQQEDQSDDG